MMKRVLWSALALLIGSAGCADESTSATRSEDESTVAPTGTIALNLLGVDGHGRAYRLRGAEFAVTFQYCPYPSYPGYPRYPSYGCYPSYDAGFQTSHLLTTEEDPGADYLSVRVVPGVYSVALRGDWYIERLTDVGYERVERVVALSEMSQQTWVYQNSVSQVVFLFGVDGTLIDFRHGDVRVDVRFQTPDETYDGGLLPDGGFDPGFLDAGGGAVMEADAGVME